jgi:hypothetical protein
MKNKETLETKLKQLFRNRSNCYADVDNVVQAMDENCFIETIKELQQERMYSHEEVNNLISDILYKVRFDYSDIDVIESNITHLFEQFKKIKNGKRNPLKDYRKAYHDGNYLRENRKQRNQTSERPSGEGACAL